MSLDIWFNADRPSDAGSGIFLRENGATREVSRDEWNERFPGTEPVVVERADRRELASFNITHNLNRMAEAAGIYGVLWHPEDNGILRGADLIGPLREGLRLLESAPDRFRAYDSPNGWGLYEHFVPFVRKVLAAAETHPTATVGVSI